jgi:hypothetical protein
MTATVTAAHTSLHASMHVPCMLIERAHTSSPVMAVWTLVGSLPRVCHVVVPHIPLTVETLSTHRAPELVAVHLVVLLS